MDDDYQEILSEMDSLEDDLKEHCSDADDIKGKDDSAVRVAMQEVNEWKKRKQNITKQYRKYNSLAERVLRSLQSEVDSAEGRTDANEDLDSLKTDKEELETRFDEMEEFVDSFFANNIKLS